MENYKTSLFDWIYSNLTGYAQCFIPKECKLCKTKRKGNMITGYYFGCECRNIRLKIKK